MLRKLLFLAFVVFSSPGITQFEKVFDTRMNHSWFSCDANKNVYAIIEGKFQKFSPPYSSSLSYNIQKEGSPSFIDVSFENQIVLFFKQSNKIILLDSSLNELMAPIYLEELGLFDVSMVFAASDRGLWFYKPLSNSLTKLNTDFFPVVRGLSFNQYFLPPNRPNHIVSYAGKIYLNVPSNGILVLNQNGAYQTAYQLPGIIDFQIDNKALYFFRDEIIYCYDYRNLKIKKVYLPDEPGILNAWFFEDQVFVLSPEGFSIYKHAINPLEGN